MLRAADTIGRFVAGMDMATFVADELVAAGVYYEFSIIGEALSQVRRTEPDIAEQVSEYERVIGFRNQIIHGYAKLDHEVTWRVIDLKLPILRRELEQLLAT